MTSGTSVGTGVGPEDGTGVLLGRCVGSGLIVGSGVGTADGEGVVGAEVGDGNGSSVGAGLDVGTGVGSGAGHPVPKLFPASTAQMAEYVATI